MKVLKQTICAALILSVLAVSPVLAKQDHKVTICHATSSETNPYVRIVVDEHATAGHFDNNGTPESGHEDDLLFQGEVDCPQPEPPVVDVCPNIQGNQEEIPEGMELIDEECVEIVVPPPPPPPDEPPTDPPTEPPVEPPNPPNDPPVPDNPPSSPVSSGNRHSSSRHSNTGGDIEGNTCSVVTEAPTNFTVESGTPNDQTLELAWTPKGDTVEVRYGHVDGVWLYSTTTEDDGQYSLGGLTNGQHYWVQVRSYNDCSEGYWSVSVDPLP